jgi:hydroxymethylpyrimidine/phosphomethylpyrimidine kinase
MLMGAIAFVVGMGSPTPVESVAVGISTWLKTDRPSIRAAAGGGCILSTAEAAFLLDRLQSAVQVSRRVVRPKTF